MAQWQLRRFDVQAKWAFVLSLLSVVPCVAAAFFLYRNYNRELGQVVYSAGGMFLPVFLGCAFASLGPSAIGLLLGLSSAGQRRNDRPTQSWIAFFLGGTITTINLVLLLAYAMLRFPQPG